MCVSFDTGPEWANWKALFREFKQRYPDIELTYNDLGSAATVVALEKMRRRPQADTAYYFAASAVDAARKDLVAPFRPVGFEQLPEVFREAEGRWFTVHTLNIAFLVNRKLVARAPEGWADLLKPEYRNAVTYLDPRSTGVGQVLTFAAAYGNGGDEDNVKAGTDYLGRLHAAGNVQRVEGTTPYAKFLKGEIPVWIGYENDGLKARHADGMGDACEIVIPREASVAAPMRSAWSGRPQSERGQAVAQLHHERCRPAPVRARLRAAVAARCLPAGRGCRACPPHRRSAPGRGQAAARPRWTSCGPRPSRPGRRAMIGRFGAWPAWAFMGLFFVLPLAALALEAFAEGGGAWARLYANPLLPGALRNTLALGLTAGACRRWWGRRWPWNWRASPSAAGAG